jgi:hypothetical protein
MPVNIGEQDYFHDFLVRYGSNLQKGNSFFKKLLLKRQSVEKHRGTDWAFHQYLCKIKPFRP